MLNIPGSNKMSTLMNRMTLNQIKERNTVLKNINHGRDDSQAQSKEELLLFRRVTSLIEEHLMDNKHCFNSLIGKFQKFILEKYEPYLKDRELTKDTATKVTKKVCNQIGGFI